MKCPNCGCLEDKVLETRHIGEGNSIRRRRECISCSYRFTTYEQIEDKPLMVVKRDQRREEFNLDKFKDFLVDFIEAGRALAVEKGFCPEKQKALLENKESL